MEHKTQKIVTAFLVALAVIGGFEIIINIINLNQPVLYLQAAFVVYFALLFLMGFLFDLHFKNRGSWQRAKLKHRSVIGRLQRAFKISAEAFWDRVSHLRNWQYFTLLLDFLILPSFIYWATVSLFYVNLGNIQTQQLALWLSSAALILNYWYMHEAFHRKKEIVDSDIFVVLAVVKIYTAAVLFAASLSFLKYYCLEPSYFVLEIFCFTFLLIYQALFQHRLVNFKNIAIDFGISLVMAIIGYYVYVLWGFNYFTAAIFLAVCYNIFWGTFHYYLDRSLTLKAFLEVLFISLFIAAMVISTTNFRAQIIGGC